MAPLVYLLCALAALGCALLLGRAYRRGRSRLLLWSTLCFACLTANNLLVAVDLVILPDVNLFFARQLTALVGMLLLLYGLIWESG
jgi:uncharacterized protein DUF5985